METTLRTPVAQTFTISDVVRLVADGHVRVPQFQRTYRWETKDVLALFDSVYNGYPIGSLLLWRRSAEAELLHLGTIRIEAPAQENALWVVDGQQRLTSLAAVLLSVGEIDDRRFSIFFDLSARRFVAGRKQPPPAWLPMNRVIDTRALLRWLGELQRSGGAEDLVSTAEDLAKRIREYQIPAYLVETNDETTLRTIFDRLNTYGKPLSSADVFQALHGGRHGQQPQDLRTLSHEVAELGFGRLEDNTLLRTVLALRAPDVYRDFREEFSPSEDPSETFREAAQALERVVTFLRSVADIVHIRLLPYQYVIPVLARFFALHPDPAPRSLTLLRRWIWRDALARESKAMSVSTLRNAVKSVDHDEDASVQRLLDSTRYPQPSMPDFTARLNQARARANIAMMASWRPRSLVDGTLIDISSLFASEGPAIQTVIAGAGADFRSSVGNRMLHVSTVSPIADLLVGSPLRGTDATLYNEVLDSHAIPPMAIVALEARDPEQFLRLRHADLGKRLAETAFRLAEWDSIDRPPLTSLLVDDGPSNE